MSKLFSRLYNAFISCKGYTDHVSPHDETEYERFIPIGKDCEVLVKNIPNILYPTEYLLNYARIACFYTAVLLQLCRTLTPEYTIRRNETLYDVFCIPSTIRRDGYTHHNPELRYVKNVFVREWSETVRHFKTIGHTMFAWFIARKEDTIRKIDYFRILSDERIDTRDNIYLFVPRVQGLTVDRSWREYIPEPTTSPTLDECPICFEYFPSNRMASLRCGHSTCPDCISGHINYQKNTNPPVGCPMCRKPIINITARNESTISKVYFKTN